MKIDDVANVPNLNYAWGGLIIEELIRNGVNYFCIAPGSRSAPLTATVAKHPQARTIVHYDERGLAFFALGYVSATGKPAALICSSGTAVANFFPAVVEAAKKKLPLILLTADRPPELQNSGALQTIDQEKIFGNYVRWYTTLPAPDLNIKPEVVLTTIDQAVFRAQDAMGGPVHINCMFREPLAPDKNGFNGPGYFASLQRWLGNQEAYTRYSGGNVFSDISADREVVSIINHSSRGIMVVGKLSSSDEQQAVIRLAEKLHWPVFPDIVSGLRFSPHPHIIPYYDQVLLSGDFGKKYPIDTVLHLGGRITSKRWYQYIERHRPANYITVLAHALRNDPLHVVSVRIKAKIRDFAQSLLPVLDSNPLDDYLFFLRRASAQVGSIIDDVTAGWKAVNEIGVARTISQMIPEGHGLFLSNSMPVRDLDMYAAVGDKQVVIGGNRGASGIDGITASACGFARGLNTRVTLLSGDLAFLHDLNSLALVKSLNEPIIIVVLNNDGGGIFSFLPIAGSPSAADVFNPFFGTPHHLEFPGAARMFGLDYAAPTTMEEFTKIYQKALTARTSIILEIKCQREENFKLHQKMQEKIKAEIDTMMKME